jgi:hypothetical protein
MHRGIAEQSPGVSPGVHLGLLGLFWLLWRVALRPSWPSYALQVRRLLLTWVPSKSAL